MINADIIFNNIFKHPFNTHNHRFMMMFLPIMVDLPHISSCFFDFLLEHDPEDDDDEEIDNEDDEK